MHKSNLFTGREAGTLGVAPQHVRQLMLMMLGCLALPGSMKAAADALTHRGLRMPSNMLGN